MSSERPIPRRRVALLLVVSGVVSGTIVAVLAWPVSSYLTKLDQAWCALSPPTFCGIGWKRAYELVGRDVLGVAGIAFLLVVLVFSRRGWFYLLPPSLAIVAGVMLPLRGEHMLPGERPPLFFFDRADTVGLLRSFGFIIERHDPSWSWTAPVWMEHRLLWAVGLWFAMLLPATVLVLVGRRRRSPSAERGKTFSGIGVAAVAALSYGAVLYGVSSWVGLLGDTLEGSATSRWSPVTLGIWCFSYGALLGRRRPWWPWLHVLVPFLTAPILLSVVAHTELYWRPVEHLPDLAGQALFIPFVVMGACSEPLAQKVDLYRKHLRGSERRYA